MSDEAILLAGLGFLTLPVEVPPSSVRPDPPATASPDGRPAMDGEGGQTTTSPGEDW